MTARLEPSEENARRCAALINQYWAEKGIIANAMVNPVVEDNGKVCWTILSNLINGMPPSVGNWKDMAR